MAQVRVKQLGYLGFHVSDLAAWEDFAVGLLGVELNGKAENGALYFRWDEFHHRLIVQGDGQDDLAYAGWEVQNKAELEAVSEQLRAGGTEVSEGSVDDARIRGVLEFRRFTDPEGFIGEVFYGPLVADELRVPRTLRGKFVTGDLGLGHFSVAVTDIDRFVDFYETALGFRISGCRAVEVAPGQVIKVSSLRCNQRHHSISMVEMESAKLLHVGLELEEVDEVGKALDKAIARDLVEVSLGRHQADHMLSFYMRSPSGFQIEYGWGGRRYGDDRRVEQFEGAEPSIWGHAGLI